MKNPNFLILDEPTNDLDIVTLQTLEEFLQEFQGCVLLVSHDRYFLDKLVDHVFAFEGNGIVKDYPGNYSEYRDWKDEQEEEAPPAISPATQVAVVKAEHMSPAEKAEQSAGKKLSYKEQRELELLEKELEEMEQRKKGIEASLSSSTNDHQQVEKLSKEFSDITHAIDEKTMRWLELQD